MGQYPITLGDRGGIIVQISTEFNFEWPASKEMSDNMNATLEVHPKKKKKK